MKHYLMLPQDTIRILPPEDGTPGCIELVCERTMIDFMLDELTDVRLLTNVRVDKRRETALGFAGKDALFGADYLVLLPESHPDYAQFLAELRRYVPQIGTAEYRPLTCDQNGHHHA